MPLKLSIIKSIRKGMVQLNRQFLQWEKVKENVV